MSEENIDLDKKIAEYLQDVRDGKNVNVEEYFSLAKKIDIYNEKQCEGYVNVLNSLGYRTFGGNYSEIRRGINDRSLDDRLAYADVLTSYICGQRDDIQFRREHVQDVKNMLFEIRADSKLNKSQLKRVNSITGRCLKSRYLEKIFVQNLSMREDLKNVDGLDSEVRDVITGVVNSIGMDAKFQTKETFEKLIEKAYSSNDVIPTIDNTLKYWIDSDEAQGQYYRYFGINTERMPETKTELFDKYVDAKVLERNNELRKMRKNFVVKDILEGKGDKLKPEDIIDVLKDDKDNVHSSKILKKIGFSKAMEVKDHADKMRDNPLSCSQRLMMLNMKLSHNPKIADVSGLVKGVANLSSDVTVTPELVEETKKVVEEVYDKIKQSPQYEEAVFNKEESERIKAELENAYKDRDRAYSKVKSYRDLQYHFGNMERNAKGKYSVLSSEVWEKLTESIEKGIENSVRTGEALKIELPPAKLPLMFGRSDAKIEYGRLESGAAALESKFNSYVKNLSKEEIEYRYGENLGKVLDKNTLDKVVKEPEEKQKKADGLKKQLDSIPNGWSVFLVVSECEKSLEKLDKASDDKIYALEKIKEVNKKLGEKNGEHPPVSAEGKKGDAGENLSARDAIMDEYRKKLIMPIEK